MGVFFLLQTHHSFLPEGMEKLLNQHFVVGALTPSFPWQLLVKPDERGRGKEEGGRGIGGRKKVQFVY